MARNWVTAPVRTSKRAWCTQHSTFKVSVLAKRPVLVGAQVRSRVELDVDPEDRYVLRVGVTFNDWPSLRYARRLIMLGGLCHSAGSQ